MKKKIIYILILLTIFATVKVVAETLIEGRYVQYDNTRSNTEYNNAQKAVEDLYEKLKEKECLPQNISCPTNKDCVKKIGQLITINNENFFVIKSNQFETTLISQNVLSQTTGKQETSDSLIQFSSTNYWIASSTLKDKYGVSYPAEVYDSNSSIYTILEAYKNNILNRKGNIVKKIKLMSYKEATNLECTTTTNTCNEWLSGEQDFWLESAQDNTTIYYIDSSNKRIASITYNSTKNIRPVIIVRTTEI